MELIQVTRSIVLVISLGIFLPPGGNGLFLDMEFHKTLTGGLDLTVHKTHSDVGFILQCAVLCTEDRALDHRCLAFRYDDLGSTCDLYTEGSVMLPHPGVEIFQYQGVFHVIKLNDRWYSAYLSDVKKNFIDARDHCKNLGGYLLEFDHPDEYEVIRKISTGYHDLMFVGGNDIDSEGEWVTDRDRLPINTDNWLWATGQPDAFKGEEDCLLTYTEDNFKIYDTRCEDIRLFFCEKDI